MPQGSDSIQSEWFRNKGKGPSIIELSNEIRDLKLIIRELSNKINELEKIHTNDGK